MTMKEHLTSRAWGNELYGSHDPVLVVPSDLEDKMICKGLSPGRIPNATE
jgi:hypothetical protein